MHDVRTAPNIATTLLLAALVASCSVGGVRNPFAGGPTGERTITLDVRNNNFDDATIYVFRGGERVRAGVVTGKTSETFRIPWGAARSFQVVIDLLGGGRCVTRELRIEAGAHIEVQVPLDLDTDPECRRR